MKTHLDKERFSKIAQGTELLTPAELEHLEDCSDCVDAIAEQIRERLRREEAAKRSDGQVRAVS